MSAVQEYAILRAHLNRAIRPRRRKPYEHPEISLAYAGIGYVIDT